MAIYAIVYFYLEDLQPKSLKKNEIDPIFALFRYERYSIRKKSVKRSSIKFMIKNAGMFLSQYETEKSVEDSCQYKIYAIKKNILNMSDYNSDCP
jgi:aspartate/tyrosine/aromatic aminotransferase